MFACAIQMGSIIICKYILNYAFIVYLRIININLVNYLYFNCICELIFDGGKRYIIKHDITR